MLKGCLTVLFGHLSAIVLIPTCDQYAFVLQSWCLLVAVNKLGKRGMALDEHARIEGNSERLHNFRYSYSLMFTATIGEEDEGYAVFLEQQEGFSGAWERIGTPEKHAIDAVGMSVGYRP